MAISTLNLSAIKLSESSINSGNLGTGTRLATASVSSSINGVSIFARLAAIATAASCKKKITIRKMFKYYIKYCIKLNIIFN